MFSCTTKEGADYQWFKNGKKAGNVHTNKTNSTHHVNINLSNNGTQVYCEATNGSGTVQSEIASLIVLGKQIISNTQCSNFGSNSNSSFDSKL